MHRSFNGAMNTAVQHAAIVAIAEAQRDAAGMRDIYAQRRIEMADALASVKGLEAVLPAGAFYFFCRYADSRPSAELARAAAEAGVLVRPGREFGIAGEGFVRLSFAVAPEIIREGVRRLASVLNR